MRCKVCGQENESGARYCVHCGAELSSQSSAVRWLPFALGGVAIVIILLTVLLVVKVRGNNALTEGKADESQANTQVIVNGEVKKEKEEEPANDTESNKTDKKSVAKTTKLEGDYPPRFSSADASSKLADQYYAGEGTFSYGPELVLDDNTQTAWNEGVDGPGIGQWIRVSAPTKQRVSGVFIRNGYPRKELTYYNNHRIKNCTIELSDGYKLTTTLQDSYNQWQDIAFDQEHDTLWVKIAIDSVYEGQKYDDTCLSGVRAY